MTRKDLATLGLCVTHSHSMPLTLFVQLLIPISLQFFALYPYFNIELYIIIVSYLFIHLNQSQCFPKCFKPYIYICDAWFE